MILMMYISGFEISIVRLSNLLGKTVSGIVGLIHTNQAPVDPSWLRRMTELMTFRGQMIRQFGRKDLSALDIRYCRQLGCQPQRRSH